MPISHAIVLGVIQGLTEILPVSSSAHLVIVPLLFRWQYQGLAFDVALHLGTALALISYFFKDWLSIIGSAFAQGRVFKNNILWCILAATAPAALAGLLLEEKAETVFRSPLLIALMLFVFALILWMADHVGAKKLSLEKMDLKRAFMIGVAQAVAIIPGVSRSGITMTAARFQGFSREAAARFSFLLATPIVIAAGVLKLSKLHAADMTVSFWAGILASAISGFAAIGLLMGLVRRASFTAFVLYRIALSVIILVLYVLR